MTRADAVRRLLTSYVLPGRAGRTIVAAVVVYATGSGLYLAGSTVFFLRGVGLDAGQVGLGLTVAGLVGFLTTVPVSMLARRIGPLQLLRLVQVWRGVCLVGLAFADDVWTFTLAVSLFMVSQGPVLPMVQLVVGAVVGDEAQTRSLGVIGSVSNVGMCIGALAAAPFLSLGGLWPLRWTLLLGGACCVASALLLGLLRVGPVATAAPASRWHRGLLPVLRDRRYLALTGVNGVLFLHTALLGIGLPLWLVQATDAPTGLLSVLITINTALAIVLQVHIARAVQDTRGGVRVLRASGIALAVTCLLLIASSHTVGWWTVVLLVLAAVLLTAGELLQAVGGWELSYRHAPAAARTEYLSVFALGGAAVGIVGPALIALVLGAQDAGLAGLAGLFLATGLAATVVGAALARAEARTAQEQASPPTAAEQTAVP